MIPTTGPRSGEGANCSLYERLQLYADVVVYWPAISTMLLVWFGFVCFWLPVHKTQSCLCGQYGWAQCLRSDRGSRSVSRGGTSSAKPIASDSNGVKVPGHTSRELDTQYSVLSIATRSANTVCFSSFTAFVNKQLIPLHACISCPRQELFSLKPVEQALWY